ncbi:MAG: host attachment protein [Gammaproteobacteria bacterium]|nr:host attachment protein [Gammaproteobacteria bacterium]
MTMPIWVLSANGARAALYQAETATGALTLVEQLEHPKSRAHQGDLLSDRAGRSFDRRGDARHALAREVDPKQQEHIRFAQQLVEHLEQGRNSQSCKRIVLVAAPAFLGLLREQMPAPLRSLVTFELDKDLTGLDGTELRRRLPQAL